MSKTHRSIFLKEVKDAFPELTSALNSQHGLLHCEMHEFHAFVQGLVEAHQKEQLIKAFQIVERHFQKGNSALVNAICVSFLEHLDLGIAMGKPSWAVEYLPLTLKGPYMDLRNYHSI